MARNPDCRKSTRPRTRARGRIFHSLQIRPRSKAEIDSQARPVPIVMAIGIVIRRVIVGRIVTRTPVTVTPVAMPRITMTPVATMADFNHTTFRLLGHFRHSRRAGGHGLGGSGRRDDHCACSEQNHGDQLSHGSYPFCACSSGLIHEIQRRPGGYGSKFGLKASASFEQSGHASNFVPQRIGLGCHLHIGRSRCKHMPLHVETIRPQSLDPTFAGKRHSNRVIIAR